MSALPLLLEARFRASAKVDGARPSEPSAPRIRLVKPVPQEKDDEALIAAYLRGDARAFRALWNRHFPAVRTVLRRHFGADPGHEDLAQEVFLIFAQRAADLAHPRALRAFLVTIAIRLAQSERRRRRTRALLTLTPTGALPDGALLPADFEAFEAARALEGILERLSARRRLAFTLRYIDRLTVKQVAAALAVSRATAKREIFRAQTLVERLAAANPALRAYSQGSAPGRRRSRRTSDAPGLHGSA